MIPEAREQAEAILQKNPNDAEALKFLLVAKVHNRGEDMMGSSSKHIPSADEVATRWAAADPDNPEPYFFILSLMAQNGRSGDEIVARANAMGKAHPTSPLSKLVLARAYQINNDRINATQLLKEAAAQPMPSTHFAQILSHELDSMSLYSDSLALLQKQSKANNDPALAEDLANRHWEMGDTTNTIALTDGLEDKLSPQGKAIRAIALFLKGKTAESTAIQQQLASAGNPVATAWATILTQIYQPSSISPRQIVDACDAALRSEAGKPDPYLEFFQAEAYSRLGERELAIDGFRNVGRENPTWVVPLVRLSQLELERGQNNIAFEAAMYACERGQQKSVSAAIALAKAWQAISEDNQQNTAAAATKGPPDRLINLVEQMHKALPNEEQTLGMYVSLLCQVQPSRVNEAKAELREALANNKSLTQDGLIHLAQISNQFNLGMTDQCFQMVQEKFGMTPSLGFAEAMSAYHTFDSAHGWDLLQKAKTHNSKPDTALAWDMACARYLEQTNDPRAEAAWVALGDTYPKVLAIQQTLLQTRSVQGNHDFLSRTIERVHQLTGNNALTWAIGTGTSDACKQSVISRPGKALR